VWESLKVNGRMVFGRMSKICSRYGERRLRRPWRENREKRHIIRGACLQLIMCKVIIFIRSQTFEEQLLASSCLSVRLAVRMEIIGSPLHGL